MPSDLEVERAAMCRLEPINEAMSWGDSQIQKFYENAVILMTGGTGFLGKHLIEKLFRSCNIKKMYLIIRQKNNKTREQRLADILDDMLFEDLYKQKPNFLSSIETVHGDISEVGLAMSEDERQVVIAEVDFIFHVAATVQFNAPIEKSTIINVRGTREILQLAKECKKLRSFVHMSTAYSHATYSRSGKDVVDDFYPTPISSAALIDMAELVDVTAISSVAPRLLEDWPNTYTFTKAVTEELLRNTDGLPACIVRPSTVVGAYTEPRPGWIDKSCLSGPTGLCHAIKMGVLHQVSGSSEISIDYIPVDFVTNVAIAAGWETAVRYAAGHGDVKIYPVCSTRSRLTWGEICDALYKNENGVSPRAVWYSFAMNVKNMYSYTALHWLVHLIPAYLVDCFGMLVGKKPEYTKLYKKIHKLSDVMHYFTTHEWLFRDINTLTLYQKMSTEDQAIFNFDVMTIDWREMMLLWAIGLRRFILKDGLQNTDYAQKKQFWFKIATFFLFGGYVYVFWIVLNFLGNMC